MKSSPFIIPLLLFPLTLIPAAVTGQGLGGKPIKPVKEDKVAPKPAPAPAPKPAPPAKPEAPLTPLNLTGAWTRGMAKGQRAIRWYGNDRSSLTVWDSTTHLVVYHRGGGWSGQGMESWDGASYSSPVPRPEWLISTKNLVAFQGPNSMTLQDTEKSGVKESWSRVSSHAATPVPGAKPNAAGGLAGVWERNLPGARRAVKWYGLGRVSMTESDSQGVVLKTYEGTWQVEENRSTESLECATKAELKLLEKPIVHRVTFQDENRVRLSNVEGGPQEEWRRVLAP